MSTALGLGHVSASYVNLLFDWLAAAHPQLLLRMPYNRPQAGELNRIDVQTWAEMLEWVHQQLGDPAMPLHVAATVRPANMGLLGYVASCCNNLGEAFARLQQFEGLVYSVNALTVVSVEERLVLRWDKARGRPGHWVDSLAIAVLVAFTNRLIEHPVYPIRVQFINPSPCNAMDFEAFFHCKVAFGGEFTEVEWPAALLQTPLKSPDQVMRAMLDAQAEALLRQVRASEEGIPGFQRALQEAIGSGQPTLTEVAKRLCISSRTLQRRLLEQGYSFRDELERVRIEMAQRCLEAGELSLSDIANLLAYNDQSAFTHAFKRALGQSPAKFQRAKRQSALKGP